MIGAFMMALALAFGLAFLVVEVEILERDPQRPPPVAAGQGQDLIGEDPVIRDLDARSGRKVKINQILIAAGTEFPGLISDYLAKC